MIIVKAKARMCMVLQSCSCWLPYTSATYNGLTLESFTNTSTWRRCTHFIPSSISASLTITAQKRFAKSILIRWLFSKYLIRYPVLLYMYCRASQFELFVLPPCYVDARVLDCLLGTAIMNAAFDISKLKISVQ